MSKIDVVIPMFNGEKYIERTLDSLIAQTYAPNKVIIVDDGSIDSSLQLANNYQSKMPNLTILKNAHKGVSAARNAGISASSGEYISFLDCDDFWAPEKLQNQINHLKNHPECAAVFSNCYINNEINHSQYKAEVNSLYEFSPLNILTQRYRVIGSASSICIKRKVFEVVGLFDESLQYGEDYEEWVRVSRAYKICEISNVDVFISKRENSLQTSKGTGYSRFKNATAYFNVWNGHLKVLETEKRSFEQLIFPDIAKALVAAPGDLRLFHRYIKENYPEIHKIVVPNKFKSLLFIVRNLSRFSATTFKSLFRKNFIQ